MKSTQGIKHKLVMKTENQVFYRQLSDAEAEIITKELVECLAVFDEICRKKNLTYLIVAGGLIGAIREGKMLPWDDDIDLVMPRNDYLKFQDIFKNSKYTKEYTFKYPQDNKVITMGAHFYNHNHGLKKLISEDIGNSFIYESYAYLDIVPLDSCCDNNFLNKIKGKLVDFLQMGYISRRCFKKYDPFLAYLAKQSRELQLNLFARRLFALPFMLIPKKIIFKQLDSLLHYEENSQNMTISYGAWRYFGEELPREVFLPAKNIEFNGLIAMVPNDCHTYLEHRYGNYMKAPSKAERNTRMIRLRSDWKKYISI